MAEVKRVSFYDIITNVQAYLAEHVPLADRAIPIVRQRYIPKMVSDTEILLIPGGITPDEGTFTGGGRIDSRVTRPLVVFVRARTSRSVAESDAGVIRRLTSLEDRVLDLLSEYHPENADTHDLLTIDPMRVMTGLSFNIEGEDLTWGSSPIPFAVMYYPLVTVAF